MKILFVVPHILYPVNSGSRMRANNFVVSLQPDNELFLIYGKAGGGDMDDFGAVDTVFSKSWTYTFYSRDVMTDRGNASKRKHSFLTPWEAQNINHDLEDKIVDIINTYKIDVVFCRYFEAAIHVLSAKELTKVKVVFDIDDIQPVRQSRDIKSKRNRYGYHYMRMLLNNMLFSRYHSKFKIFDEMIVCSDFDKRYVEEHGWSKNVSVIENSIDCSKFSDVKDLSREVHNNKMLLFCGNLGYMPNVQGLGWFIREVWPLIKQEEASVQLLVVGLDPDSDVVELCGEDSITLHANVESVLPYYADSCASIVPLHVAGGTRIKILESLACKRPVISTTIGAEGLELEKDRDYLCADSASSFAGKCVKVLKDYELVRKLSVGGAEVVHNKYDTSIVKSEIKKLFG